MVVYQKCDGEEIQIQVIVNQYVIQRSSQKYIEGKRSVTLNVFLLSH